MNSENTKKVTNQAIEQLITALNEGRSETLTQYLAAIVHPSMVRHAARTL
jgi:hypothetical protein